MLDQIECYFSERFLKQKLHNVNNTFSGYNHNVLFNLSRLKLNQEVLWGDIEKQEYCGVHIFYYQIQTPHTNQAGLAKSLIGKS